MVKNEIPQRSTHMHEWACQQRNGEYGEVVNLIALSQAGIALIEKDAKNTSEVCSDGVVVCFDCRIHYNNEEARKDKKPDLGQLKERLVRIRHVKTPLK